MGDVISFDFAKPQLDEGSQQSALAQCFARHRRIGDDVFWLKENAEFLNVHETSGKRLTAQALSAYEVFYHDVETASGFSPNTIGFCFRSRLILRRLALRGRRDQRFVLGPMRRSSWMRS